MAMFRRNCLRALTLILVAFIAVAFTSMTARPVNAEEEQVFELTQGASIRDYTDEQNTYYGLRFETSVSTAWFDANSAADKYSFGTLIFPKYVEDEETKELTVDNYKVNFNGSLDATTNKKNLDAIKFIYNDNVVERKGFTYHAAITFDQGEVLKALCGVKESYTEAEINEANATLKRVYKREFTAISYASLYVEETDTWTTIYSTNTYTDSMERVAMRLQNDPEWAEVAKNYLPNGEETQVENIDGYAINGNGTLEVNDFEQENHSVNYDVSNLKGFTLDSKVLVQDTDYTIVDNTLKFTDSLMAESLGKYRYLYAFDNNNNLVVIKVLFAHKALATAEEVQEAFDYGIRDIYVEKYYEHNESYVLAGNIDMEGIIIENAVTPRVLTVERDGEGNLISKTSDATEVGYSGIFDGRGYAIYNATVEMTSASIAFKNADGTTGYHTEERRGFFHTLKPGSVVRNVAFINLAGNNKYGETANANFGLGGILSFSSSATIENIYVDITSSPVVRGPFGNFGAGASLKNAIINFQMPEGYDFSKDYPAITTNVRNAYSYGSLTGAGTSGQLPGIPYENVQVISKAPIFVATGDQVDELVDDTSARSAVWYGENETELLYKFNAFDTVHGQVEHTVQSTAGVHEEVEGVVTVTGKTRVMEGVRRYNDIKSLVADTENETNIQALRDTKLFKTSHGEILWHSEKVVEKVNVAIEYDAYATTFKTAEFDNKNIEKFVIIANGTKYVLTQDQGFTKTEENGESKYTFSKKTSYTDETVGIPYMDASKSDTQNFSIQAHTKDKIYYYTNVCYWTVIISDPAEFKTALDITYTANNKFNFGFYKLDADIDLTGVGFSYSGYSSMLNGQSQNQTHQFGFMGQFDGCGYSLKNLQNGKFSKGIFGNFVCDTTQRPKIDPKIQNLAVLNFTGNSAPVFGVWVNGHNVYFENLYRTP